MEIKKLRVLSIIFEKELKMWQIPLFRSGIIQLVGVENLLFHNHSNDNYRYKYPLIQYKIIHNHAAIICIDKGTDEIHAFFQQKNRVITVGNDTYELGIKQLQMNVFNMRLWNTFFNYKVHHWLPLNEENYLNYQNIKNKEEVDDFLKKILIANILSFAKGIEWRIDDEIGVSDFVIYNQSVVSIKGIGFQTFDIGFSSNVFLPIHIGLGKSVSKGLGVIVNRKN